MAPLIGTLLTLAFLGLAPTGDPSDFCDAPPIARLFGQRVEVDRAGFFDPAPSATPTPGGGFVGWALSRWLVPV